MQYSVLRKMPLFLIISLLATILCFADGQSPRTGNRGVSRGCDEAALAESKTEFIRLRNLRRTDFEGLSEEEFRAASSTYILEAENCYESKYGTGGYQNIDDGGLWAPATFSRSALNQPANPNFPEHSLVGTKWGAGAVTSGQDAVGPRLPGGAVSYSFMTDGIDLSAEDAAANPTDDPNTAISSLPDFESCFFTEIRAAFDAWSAVADIEFSQTTDSGAPANTTGAFGDIRVGAHAMDGPGGVLGHAYFPPPGGNLAGDLHFDSAETWACHDLPPSDTDIGIVALHEIGHAIGLTHEFSDEAVMAPLYSPTLSFPLADDIIGAGELYGGSPTRKSFFFGDVGIGTDSPGASLQVLRTDGTAKILVEETSGTTAARFLFQLINNGGSRFSFKNSSTNKEWFFSMDGNQDFSTSFIGTGGSELLLKRDGTVQMGPGPNTVFDLSPTGNLVIGGALTEFSDRNGKKNIQSVDGQQVLEKLAQLPLSEWTYKTDEDGVRHLGPMAQDFQAAFGLGQDENHLATMDTSGVALAAIKGLNERLQTEMAEKDARIERLEAQIAEITQMLAQK